jgi:WD40 repeat protein
MCIDNQSLDGAVFAGGVGGGGCWVWEAGTDREFHNLEGHKGAVTSLAWRDDSNMLATASEDGTIKLWGMEDGKLIKSITAHDAGVTCLHFTHDGRLGSGGRDRLVKLWDQQGRAARSLPPFGELLMKAAATYDGNRIVAGDWSGEVRLMSGDGKAVGTLPANPR